MPIQCDNKAPQAVVITSCKQGGSQIGRYRLDALNTPRRYWTVVSLPIEVFSPIPSLNQRATSITSLPVCIPFQSCRHHPFRSIRWSKVGIDLLAYAGSASILKSMGSNSTSGKNCGTSWDRDAG